MQEQIDRKDLIYETIRYAFNFQQLETVRTFGDSIFHGKITLGETDKKQRKLLSTILEFNSRAIPNVKTNEKKKKRCLLQNILIKTCKTN